jgi:hypothetical protein
MPPSIVCVLCFLILVRYGFGLPAVLRYPGPQEKKEGAMILSAAGGM